MASIAPTKSIDPGRVISRGFTALKENFLPFFAVALLLAGVPAFFLQYFMFDARAVDPDFIISFAYWGPIIGSFVTTAIGSSLLQAVLARSTILHLSGRGADVPGSAMAALAMALPIIGVAICSSVMVMLGLFLLIIPGVMISCALAAAVPALVEERCGVFGSLSRSRELTRGSRWQVLVLLIFFGVVSTVVSGVTSALSGVGLFPGPDATMPDPIFGGAVSGLGAALTAVVTAACTAALYVELRETKEGTSAGELASVFA